MSEYKNVIKISKNPDALKKAWGKQISENEAEQIIFSYLEEDEVYVRFTARTGRGAAHAKGQWIRLPRENTGYLTLGLVLHETAHILKKNDYGYTEKRPHGKEFVECLDSLVESEEIYEAEGPINW